MNTELEKLLNQMGMNATVSTPVDTKYIDKVLMDENEEIKVVPAERLASIPQDHLMQWCVKHAIYQIPTEELIEWLAERIDGRSAIEIGSGKSGIGRALGIPCTDSHIQTTPEVRAYYATLNQPVVEPPYYVEQVDATQAIQRYHPAVVVGCFITQQFREGDTQGSVFGPDEEWIVETVDTYIHVGNGRSHGTKRILEKPHEEFSFDWVRSRAADQSLNRIWMWHKKEPLEPLE